jgi:hypothetical protein
MTAAAHLSQLADGRGRHVDADDTLTPSRIGEPARIEPIGLRREARLQRRLARIDDVDARSGGSERIDERPRRTARLHRQGVLRADAPRHQARDPLRRPRDAAFPPSLTGRRQDTRLEKRFVQINPDILSIHGLSSSHSPEHACLSDCIISGAAEGDSPFI